MSLLGVNILEKGTPNGTVSDFDGNFEMVATPDAVLVFSYIGYIQLEVPLEGRTQLNIIMEPDQQVLTEVVVTGYKTEIKSDIASAISSVRAEEIEKMPVLGLDQALQGQVAGLQVTQATGAPGDDISIRIRGAGTIGNNNPLFVIDGIPTTGNINMFSTNDIESIQILKDGASAAVYGARAANGVILITTKKGKSGKPSFSFNSYYGIQDPVRLPELLNAREYMTIRNEGINNANALRDPRRQLDTFDLGMLDTLPDNDWLDLLFDPAPMQKYSLSATGGGESGSFYIMGEYLTQDGVYRGQRFDKYLVRFNGDIKSDRFTIGNNLSFSFTDRKIIGSSGDGAGPGNELNGIRYTLIAAPVFPVRGKDGEYINTSAQLGEPMLYGDGNANPLAFVDHTDWSRENYRVFGNVFAELKILEGLSLRTNLGIDLLIGHDKLFKEFLSVAIYNPTSLSESRFTDRNLVWNNILSFQKTFGVKSQHRFSAILGTEALKNRTEYLGASARNFIDSNPAFRYIDNSLTQQLGDINASGIVTEWSLLSYFSQATYSFDNRYVINVAVRRDGSSRFGLNNRWGLFPSISLAWNISNESFFPESDVISHIKIRSSWGQLGNQEIGIYPYSSLVETGRIVYPFGSNISTGSRVIETGNSNIKWEATTQFDVGFELSLFEDKISFISDYYIKKSTDILVRVPVPQVGGSFDPPFVNAGEVENKGLELAIVYKHVGKNFNYNIQGNIGTVRNEVLSLAESEPILGGFGLSDGPITKTEPGYPIGSFFLYQMEGLFQSQEEIDASPFQTPDTRPGDVKFTDFNGDNIIDDKDRAHLGNPFPDFIYGLSANFNYKNLDLSILLQGVQGNDVYFLYGGFAYDTQSRGFNSYRDVLNRWTPSNTDTDIPKVSVDDRNGNRRLSTRFLEDGSYLRLRNISIGYNLTDLLKLDAIQNLRVYCGIRNAFTLTKYSGLDPEIQANTNDTQGFNISSDLAVGIDWGTVPAPRTFLFGVNLDF
jgi:TonB-linked SusC/RagA family outer membrane protein